MISKPTQPFPGGTAASPSNAPPICRYVEKPAWLYCEELWQRGCEKKGTDLKKEYREWLEDYIKQGVEEKIFTRFSKALGVTDLEVTPG